MAHYHKAEIIDRMLDHLMVRSDGEELGVILELRKHARAIQSTAARASRLPREPSLIPLPKLLWAEFRARAVDRLPVAMARRYTDVPLFRHNQQDARRRPSFVRRDATDGLWHCTCRHYQQVGYCVHARRINVSYHLTNDRDVMTVGPHVGRFSNEHSILIRDDESIRRCTEYDVEDLFPAKVRFDRNPSTLKDHQDLRFV